MGIDFVDDASVSNDTATTSIVIPKPADAGDGHFLTVFIGFIGQPTITTVPDGWELLGVQDDGSNLRSAAYVKPASGEPASWTWTISAAFKNFGYVSAYSGVDDDDPVPDWASAPGDPGTSHDTPTVSVPEDGWLISAVVARHAATGDPTTWGINTGDSERYDHGSDAGSGQDISAAVWDSGAAVVAAGDYDRTLTSSQSENLLALWSIALRAEDETAVTVPWTVGVPI